MLLYDIVRPEAPNSDDFPVFGNAATVAPERRSRYQLHLPYTILLRLGWGGEKGMVYFFSSQPVDEDHCIGYVTIARNYDREQPDSVLQEFEDTIFNQDRRVVESQRPERVPFDLAAEMHLKFDAVAISYRKAMREQGLEHEPGRRVSLDEAIERSSLRAEAVRRNPFGDPLRRDRSGRDPLCAGARSAAGGLHHPGPGGAAGAEVAPEVYKSLGFTALLEAMRRKGQGLENPRPRLDRGEQRGVPVPARLRAARGDLGAALHRPWKARSSGRSSSSSYSNRLQARRGAAWTLQLPATRGDGPARPCSCALPRPAAP